MQIFVLGVGLLTISLGIVVADYYWQSLSAMTGSFAGKLGKGAGSIAVITGVLALGAYFLRLAFLWSKKNKMLGSDSVTFLIQRYWNLLRKWHPFWGMAAISLVMFHGYTMWLFKIRKVFGIYTGISAAAIMIVFLGGTGVFLYFFRQNLTMRKTHRVIAAIACILVLVHLGVAG